MKTKTYAGLDAGHNNLKLLVQDDGQEKPKTALMPSYILTNPDLFPNIHPESLGLVHYIDGARGDLSDKSWLMGAVAIQANERACIALASANDGNGKVEYCLQSLLSLLSSLPHREEWGVTVVCSNHRADVYESPIKQKMNGIHKASLAGKPSTVTVECVGVVNEATHYRPKAGNETVLLDFGGGTTIYVKYSVDGRNTDRQVLDVGVDDLISLIYDNQEVYSLLHKKRSRHLIRAGIEASKNGQVWYGVENRGGVDITEPYTESLKLWLASYMKQMLGTVLDSLRAGASLQLIGGGAMLPGLQEALTQILTRGGKERHIVYPVNKSALWLNSLALLELAKEFKQEKPEVPKPALLRLAGVGEEVAS